MSNNEERPPAGYLSAEQWRWLAVRQFTRDDPAASRDVGTSWQRVATWRLEPLFDWHYRHLNHGLVELARCYTASLLGRAAQVLDEGLGATRRTGDGGSETDHRIRLDAAKTLLTIHGVLRQRVDVMLVKEEAERLAGQYGLDTTELLAEAEAIVRGSS